MGCQITVGCTEVKSPKQSPWWSTSESRKRSNKTRDQDISAIGPIKGLKEGKFCYYEGNLHTYVKAVVCYHLRSCIAKWGLEISVTHY